MGRTTDIDDEERWERLVRAALCPQCAGRVVPIMYGLSAGPVSGVILGGCTVMPGQPTVGCESCGWRGDATDLVTSSAED